MLFLNLCEGDHINISPQYVRIYLIDHAWTYQVNDARVQLQMIPGLVERMAALMRVENEEQDKEEIIENILTEMWKLVWLF